MHTPIPEQNPETNEVIAGLEQPPIDPNEYLGTVFRLYRENIPGADYRGQRNEEQREIAEWADLEADELFDQTLLAVDGLSRIVSRKPNHPTITTDTDEEAVTLGESEKAPSLADMRDAWKQLWVGMNVLTHRLHRESAEFRGNHYPEISKMSDENKTQLMNTLFGNFQDLNALRFGAKGSGLKRSQIKYDADMEPYQVNFDKDVAQTERQLFENAAKRGYRSRSKQDKKDEKPRYAMHPAGKMTPSEFTALRKEYPEVDMNHFAYDAAFLKDMAKYYAESENH